MNKGISLCIIGKDEVEGLERLVKSCNDYVDEILLLSTAGDKKLERMANKLGVKYYPYKWKDNFADARNEIFSEASFEVQFWADLDDVILGAENLPKLAEKIYEGKTDWISLPYIYAKDKFGRILAKQIKPRLTRRGTGKWNKTVHECYEPTKAVQIISDDSVVIDHHPKEGHDADNANRNLQILLKEYSKDGEKTDARTLFYIGMTYLPLEDWKSALEFFIEFVKKTGWDEEKYFAYHYMVDCLYVSGQYDLAIDIALKAVKLFPQWSLAYFDLARMYSIQSKHDKVIQWTLVGLEKEIPKTDNFINELEYDLLPIGRLADAYMMTGMYAMALDIATDLYEKWPDDPMVKELFDTAKEVMITEKFVKSFCFTADMIMREDRMKATELFNLLPPTLDDDIRIQEMRSRCVPPKNWGEKSIVIYCGAGIGEHWAYPSIFTGIGGSENAVINMSIQLNKLGYKVTIFNNCGELQGNYDGVEYVPFHHFNPKDNYDTLIAWRTPALFNYDIRANKHIVWLHDIAYEWQVNDKIIKNTDKFVFLSKWHRDNLPTLPEDKVFISNNGIDPDAFLDKKEKKPNSLLWTSSYDRGLLPFVKNIWPLIKKEIPEVTLDIAYGWNNIDKELDLVPELRALKAELPPLLNQDGITEHGRLPQQEVIDLCKTSMVLAYASEFGETNNISSMQAQASDCYVVTTSQAGGTPERIKFGYVLQGNNIYTDKKLQREYADKVIEYLKNPMTMSEEENKKIIQDFSWSETAQHWTKELL